MSKESFSATPELPFLQNLSEQYFQSNFLERGIRKLLPRLHRYASLYGTYQEDGVMKLFSAAVHIVALPYGVKTSAQLYLSSADKKYGFSEISVLGKGTKIGTLDKEWLFKGQDSNRIHFNQASDIEHLAIDIFDKKSKQAISFQSTIEIANLQHFNSEYHQGGKGTAYVAAGLPAQASLTVADQKIIFNDCFACVDKSSVQAPYAMFWNWAAISGVLVDGRKFSALFSSNPSIKDNEEIVLIIDGTRWHDQGRESVFNYNYKEPREDWNIRSRDREVDIIFSPQNVEADKFSRKPFGYGEYIHCDGFCNGSICGVKIKQGYGVAEWQDSAVI